MKKTNRICGVDGCGKKHSARGYCNVHYQRLLKHGDPTGGPAYLETTRGEVVKWLLDHVNHEGDGCLDWPFGDDGHGYGQLQYNGKTCKAHRVICELVNGPPPFERAEAAHSCGNGKRGCVHPKHLRWATPKENNWDRVDHETDNRGERCGTHKLKEQEVLVINEQLRIGASHQALADQYGVHRCTITDIAKGKNWSWLTGRAHPLNPKPPAPANDNVPAEQRRAA